MSLRDKLICDGLDILAALSSATAWRAAQASGVLGTPAEAAVRLHQFVSCLDDSTEFRRKLAHATSRIVPLLQHWRGDLPTPEMQALAMSCLYPVSPGPSPRSLPPAQAMAVGGVQTDRYGRHEGGNPNAELDDEFEQVTKWLEWLCEAPGTRVAFSIDRNGQFLGAAGDPQGLDTTELASRAAPALEDDPVMNDPRSQVERVVITDGNGIVIRTNEMLMTLAVTDAAAARGEIRLRVAEAGDHIYKILQRFLSQVEHGPEDLF